MADSVRLKQIILNLVSNGIKYNLKGGWLTLSRQAITPELPRIKVSDTGFGISEENQKKVFNLFDRLDADLTKVKRTGIGLTITKRLVELMNGTIGFESQLGTGTTFLLTLQYMKLKLF